LTGLLWGKAANAIDRFTLTVWAAPGRPAERLTLWANSTTDVFARSAVHSRDAPYVTGYTRRAFGPATEAALADILLVAAFTGLGAGVVVLNAAEVVWPAGEKLEGAALDAFTATLGTLPGAAALARGVAGLTRWTSKTRLTTSPALLVADLLDVDAFPVGATGVAPGSTPTAAATAGGSADLATRPALGSRLLRWLDALAIFLRATAVFALLLARLFLFLFLGIGGGDAKHAGDRRQRSAQQGAARVGQGAEQIVETAAIHRADSWHASAQRDR
jgi:hypothetical protein